MSFQKFRKTCSTSERRALPDVRCPHKDKRSPQPSMQRLFGAAPRGKQPAYEAVDPSVDSATAGPAMETLRDTSSMVEKREAHLVRLIANEVDTAREHATAGQQREALLAMKRKKILEKELEQ